MPHNCYPFELHVLNRGDADIALGYLDSVLK